MSKKKHKKRRINIENQKEPIVNSFSSGPLMLDMVLREYEFESDRNKSIQSRAGILLTLVGAILVLFPALVNIPEFKKYNVSTAFEALPINIMFIGALLSFIFFIIAMFFLIRVVSVDNYKRIEFKSFSEKNARIEINKMSTALMIKYTDIVEFNHDINTKKVSLFRRSTYMILLGLIMTSISFISQLFI